MSNLRGEGATATGQALRLQRANASSGGGFQAARRVDSRELSSGRPTARRSDARVTEGYATKANAAPHDIGCTTPAIW
jgi:hypothetical protein